MSVTRDLRKPAGDASNLAGLAQRSSPPLAHWPARKPLPQTVRSGSGSVRLQVSLRGGTSGSVQSGTTVASTDMKQ